MADVIPDPIFYRVRQIISDIFSVPVETISRSSSSRSIEKWDSLNHMNLVLSLEQGFGVAFTPDEIPDLTTVQAICQKLDQKQSEIDR